MTATATLIQNLNNVLNILEAPTSSDCAKELAYSELSSIVEELKQEDSTRCSVTEYVLNVQEQQEQLHSTTQKQQASTMHN